MSGLIAENLTFQYGENSVPILCDFSLKISKGSIVLLTGASGCGKSTLCGVLAGIYPRHGGVLKSGYVFCDGVDIHNASVSQRAQLIGMMFQNPDLQFCMDTVENELVFCLENICVQPQEIPFRVEESLAFCEIEHLRTRKLHTLSGGEKQKVMLACIAALESGYILLDEPLANIDPYSGKLLCERLQRFQKKKDVTMLIVDHVISNFLTISDEVIVLGDQGSILQRGIHKGNLSEHASELSRIGISVPNTNYTNFVDNKQIAPRQTIFSLRDMKVGYNGADILRGVNIDFYKGCMTAITGKSGSGKSTLLAALSRMNSYKGSILLESREASHVPRKHYAKQVGIVFQNPQDQFVANTVYEEIAVSLRDRCIQDDMPLRIRSYLEELGLWEYHKFSPYMLSQGQQRRLAVGALLAYECKVLLCDEPTYGQDKRSVEAVMEFLLRRVRRDGLTVIFSTHDMVLAETYGYYHYWCENGRLYNCGKRQEVTQCYEL